MYLPKSIFLFLVLTLLIVDFGHVYRREKNTGIAVETAHYLNDFLWKTVVTL